MLVAARRGEEAVARLTEAIRKLESILPPSHALLAKARLNRARALAYSGDTAAAYAELDAIEGFFGAEDPPMHRWLTARGAVARLAGDYPRARSLQQAALAAVPEKAGSDRMRILPLVEMGLASLELSDSTEAEKALERALELLPHPGPPRADALVGLGRLYLARGDPARALPLLEEADAYWRDLAPWNRWAGEASHWLGRSLQELGRPGDARKALSRAARILSRSPLPADERILAHR